MKENIEEIPIENTESRIIHLLKKSKSGLGFNQICKRLNIDKSERKQLKKTLKKLKKEGILRIERGKYTLEKEETVVGSVLAYPAGFGFLHIGENEKDIYIPPFEMLRLFSNDKVEAKIVEYKGKKEVRILKVLERAKKEVVCKVQKNKKCYGIPIDENSHQKIVLDPSVCETLKNGTLVVIQIEKYPTKKSPAHGSVKKVLGHPKEKLMIIDALIYKYNLPTEYPKDALKELEYIKLDIEEEAKRRQDLRHQLCFTIDPEKARDFDDAVAIEKLSDGSYRLWVHIADVSYFVKEGSKIDQEAFKRGFTFYLPDRAIHMLPEKLSADLCSLKPGEDRLTFTCEMFFDQKGNLLDYKIYESVIKSKARLTYNEALNLIVGDPALERKYPHLVKSLRHMEDLYRILSKRRWDMGSIDFDLPETELVIDEYGEPVAVKPYERHIAHKIIEQFMVHANETVAMYLESKGYPCIYRVHEPPDMERVEKLVEILSGLGYKVKNISLEPRFFQKIIEDFEGREEENLVRFLTLRAMKRAVYSPHNLGHFGLASQHYAHFTSPIRRYPDIIVHRLLKKALKDEEIKYDRVLSYLDMAGQHLSKQERLAEEVEREAIDLLKVRFMRSFLGEDFEGIITGVMPYGFFVEIKEYLVEGLVNITLLKDDDYVYDESFHRIVGITTGKVYRLGDMVRVKIIKVDEDRGRLDLDLV